MNESVWHSGDYSKKKSKKSIRPKEPQGGGFRMEDRKITLIKKLGFALNSAAYLPYVSYANLSKALAEYIEMGKPESYLGHGVKILTASENTLFIHHAGDK